jgi:hypothetical protein
METRRLLMDNWFISRKRKYSQFARVCERRNSPLALAGMAKN